MTVQKLQSAILTIIKTSPISTPQWRSWR